MSEEALKKLLNTYSELEIKLLDELVQHFKVSEEFINSDYWRIKKLEELGILNENIAEYVSKVVKQTPKQIEDALKKIGFDTFNIQNLNNAYNQNLLRINPSVILEKQLVNNLIKYSYNEVTSRLMEISNKIEKSTRDIYLDIVEKAYIQTSEGITYQEAIRSCLLELGEKGITTLKYKTVDANGKVVGIRNYDIEGAVRRELITATHNLINNINMQVAEELDVEYLYLSEHIKCREQHFPWQGTIIKREDLIKVTRVGEVDGMGGPNCTHYPTAYFGTARGNELKKISQEEATEQYNLAQNQRYLERGIKKWKRRERIFKTAEDKEYYKRCKEKVKEWQIRNKEFTENNNLRRDFTRENVEKVTKVQNNDMIFQNINNGDNKLKYQDITEQYTTKKQYQIKKQKYFVDSNGNKYNVDGKNVILKPTQREIEVAELLGETIGGKVNIIPRINQPFGIKTPDYTINDEKFDLKQITGGGKYTIQGNLKGKQEQSHNFIIDITNAKFDIKEAYRQIDNIYNSKHYIWLNKIILIQDNKIIKAYKRI